MDNSGDWIVNRSKNINDIMRFDYSKFNWKMYSIWNDKINGGTKKCRDLNP